MSGNDGENTLGEVITFYSYKGGTGRSMALANIACLLANVQTEGQDILMIDWDLEAPGLHHFFESRLSIDGEGARNSGPSFDEVRGLIDLFIRFAQETPYGRPETEDEAIARATHCLESVQLGKYVVPTGHPNLSLMKAGRCNDEYFSQVRKFDWKDLYNRSPMLFQFFATHLTKKYRYVLIDSRTGITDVSGIGTALMPQKLVAVFTPNRQSLNGVINQVSWANEYRRKSIDERPLLVFPLTSRVDRTEPRLRDAWRLGDQEAGIEGYQPLFEELFEKTYDLSECDLTGYFDKIQVLHASFYAYGEKIAVLEEKSGGPGSLSDIYRALFERISNGISPWSEMPQDANVAKIKAQAAESNRRAKAQAVLASKAKRFAKLSTVAATCLGVLVGITTWLWETSYTIDQTRLKVKAFFGSIHLEPQMVQVPGGVFQQGDVEGLGERSLNPVHQVTVKPFALGKYEVTFDEYDRFVISEGKPLPADQGWGRGRRPVINVSWEDAKAYATWLTQKTGRQYRLPTESEWEYAARGGDKQQAWAGTNEELQLTTYAVFAFNSESKTKEVGKRAPNSFGLHDLSGNVFEWVEDCAYDTYERAPIDGSAWLKPDEVECKRRGLRGGSWDNVPADLRTSFRGSSTAGSQSSHLGFRLAQDLEP